MKPATRSLFIWSVRADSRTLYSHLARAIFCCLILITVVVAWATSKTATTPTGLVLFAGLCFTNAAIVGVAGISYFVSAVTEEKDSGNLALLNLAGVTSFGIVLSKSVSRQVAAMALLLVQLPFTQLSVTLGGISPQQILAGYIALAGWLILVSNFSLLCSVVCRTTGRAAALATVITLLFLVFGTCVDAIFLLAGTRWMPPALTTTLMTLRDQQQVLDVFPNLIRILTSNAQVPLVTAQFVHSIFAGLTFFTLSTLLFHHFSGESDHVEHGRKPVVRRLLVNRCWKPAIFWKDFVFFTGGKAIWIVKVIAYIGLLAIFSATQQFGNPGAEAPFSTATATTAFLTVMLLVSLEVLMYSSNCLFIEVRQKTAADLLMLPMSTRQIFLQKIKAIVLAVSPGLLVATGLLIAYFRPILNTTPWPIVVTSWLLITSFLIHATVLLSLYFRWAALPLAVFATIMLSPILLAAVAGAHNMPVSAAETSNKAWAQGFTILLSAGWMWLFVLLPMEVEIMARWKQMGIRS